MAEHAAVNPDIRLFEKDMENQGGQSSVVKRRARRRFRSWPLLIPVGLFALMLVVVAVAPLPSATEQSLVDRLNPPVTNGGSWSQPFGSDGLGRDLLARIGAGSWMSLRIAAAASSIAALVGITFGIASGLLGGWTDRFLTLVSEVSLTVPSVVIGVVLTATLGQSLRNLIVILTLSGWISYARVLRLQSRQIAASDYVMSARAMGGGAIHIAIRHIVPNLLPTILVLFFQQLGGMMLWEASLTYLGLGARPDTITLGGIVRDGQEQIFNGWWISVFSGMTIATAIVGFAFLGDWLREQFDGTQTDFSEID
jgi:peptide/nickel transport system permease protein